ncbi:MAG: ComEA family DNA-binding protein [Candidatus Fermentibacteraceae bacterium]
MGKLFTTIVLLAGAPALYGAFEPCVESPWLSGFAAALFPRAPSAMALNPAAPGMLDRRGFSVSASRPFGLSQLGRLAIAGNTAISGVGVGALASGTASSGYSEFTLATAAAFRLSRGLVAGVSLSARRLSIEGFGAGGAVGVDAAIVARPTQGVYLGGGCRGLYSSGLGGANAVPRTLFASAGVVPLHGLNIALSAAFHQYSGAEYGVHSCFSPHPRVAIGVGCLSGPARLSFSLGIDIGKASFSYGYGTHPDLQGSHLGEVAWGNSAFFPAPLSQPSPPEAPVVFPVNVNTATSRELDAIPGIGPARASAILQWLSEKGPIQSLQELLSVPGIGPSTLETLSRYLTAE